MGTAIYPNIMPKRRNRSFSHDNENCEGKLMYLKSIRERKNTLLREILEIHIRNNHKWYRNLNKEIEEMGMVMQEIIRKDRKVIEEEFRLWDENIWKEEIREKNVHKDL